MVICINRGRCSTITSLKFQIVIITNTCIYKFITIVVELVSFTYLGVTLHKKSITIDPNTNRNYNFKQTFEKLREPRTLTPSRGMDSALATDSTWVRALSVPLKGANVLDSWKLFNVHIKVEFPLKLESERDWFVVNLSFYVPYLISVRKFLTFLFNFLCHFCFRSIHNNSITCRFPNE